MDAGTIVRLYEDCLRSEEGIRYRRSGPPGFWLDQAVMQAIDLQHPNSPQITSLAPAKSESDNQLIAKLKAIVSRM